MSRNRSSTILIIAEHYIWHSDENVSNRNIEKRGNNNLSTENASNALQKSIVKGINK